jgi:hypothetical protein
LFICLCLFGSHCLYPPAEQADSSLSITLTEQEKAFIQAHPVIRVSNELDWAILAGILNKAMQQVDPRQYDLIVQKWIGGMGTARELANLTRTKNSRFFKTG